MNISTQCSGEAVYPPLASVARLCGVLVRVANARQGSVVIVSNSDTEDRGPGEPSIAYAVAAGETSGDGAEAAHRPH